MKLLVLGGAGMVGHKVVQTLARAPVDLHWTLRGTAADPSLAPVPILASANALEHVDALRWPELRGLLRGLRPDVVVNCIGIIKQRDAVNDEQLCTAINAELPHRLADLLSEWQGRLIHISTDCVFDGLRGSYTEDDRPNATDVYGRTKALGEVCSPNAVTLRTSVIGRELKCHSSLLDWFLSQSGRTIRGFRQVRWSGVTTHCLAAVIQDIALRHLGVTGVFNLAGPPISKYALLSRLRAALEVDIIIEPDDSFRRDMTLVGTRLETATGYRVPSWDTMLRKLVDDPTPYTPLTTAP